MSKKEHENLYMHIDAVKLLLEKHVQQQEAEHKAEQEKIIKALEEKALPLGIGLFPSQTYLKLEDAIEIVKGDKQ